MKSFSQFVKSRQNQKIGYDIDPPDYTDNDIYRPDEKQLWDSHEGGSKEHEINADRHEKDGNLELSQRHRSASLAHKIAAGAYSRRIKSADVDFDEAYKISKDAHKLSWELNDRFDPESKDHEDDAKRFIQSFSKKIDPRKADEDYDQ